MAAPTKGLASGGVVGVLGGVDVQWHDVIGLESPGLPAALASPAVTLEDLHARALPAVLMQPPMVPAHYAAPK